TRKALGVLRKGSKTDDAFPAPQHNRGSEKLYLVRELWTREENRPTRINFDDSDQSDTDSGPQASGQGIAMTADRDESRAEQCGMDKERWSAAKQKAKTARTRGAKKSRSESSMWDSCAGQESLFDISEGDQS